MYSFLNLLYISCFFCDRFDIYVTSSNVAMILRFYLLQKRT